MSDYIYDININDILTAKNILDNQPVPTEDRMKVEVLPLDGSITCKDCGYLSPSTLCNLSGRDRDPQSGICIDFKGVQYTCSSCHYFSFSKTRPRCTHEMLCMAVISRNVTTCNYYLYYKEDVKLNTSKSKSTRLLMLIEG